MSKNRAFWIENILLLVGGVTALLAGFDRLITQPNNHLLGGGLDGWKNYFTPSWYIKYDTGFQFTGMNYPYGEHVIFTDNQPLISAVLRWIHQHLFPLSDYTVGILNLLVFASLLLCMWMLFRIAKHYGVPAWLAIPGAIIITLMSPQIHRFAGHYALAYAAVIPTLWYLCILYLDKGMAWWRSALLGIAMLAVGWVHPYYLLMGFLLAMSIAAIYALQFWRNQRSRGYKGALGLASASVGSILAFQLILFLTDPVTDRLSSPYGFLEYKASWATVFLPVQGPLFETWRRFAGNIPPMTWEGFAYVGGIATFIALAWGVRMSKQLIKGNPMRVLRPVLPTSFRSTFWAIILILLFSMAIPFKWLPEPWLDALGPLRQFRSLGRFAWLFYYPFTILVLYHLYQIYRTLRIKGAKQIGIWILLAAGGIWAVEAASHVQTYARSAKSFQGDNIFIHPDPDFNQWLAEAGVEASDFQAILPIPTFFIGSDKFIPRNQTEATTARAFKMAYDTGLPLACGSMSRTSVTQSTKLVQLLSSTWVQKEVLKDYPDRRPLLILLQSEVPLTWEEQQLLRGTKLLLEKGNFSLRSLDLATLSTDPARLVAQFQAQKSTLVALGNDWYASDSTWFHFDGFDHDAATPFGQETMTDPANKKEITLYNGPLPDTLLVASMWIKIDPDIAGFPSFMLQEFDATGQMIRDEAHGIMFGAEVYLDWIRFDFEFTPAEQSVRTRIFFFDRDPEAESLLIKPVGVDVWNDGLPGHRLMMNNAYAE